MATKSFNAFEMAQAQFDQTADQLGLDQATRDLLRFPLREYTISIPIRMDNGSFQVFRGFRVQHNDARGPGKGGIRFHPMETLDTVRALIHVDDLEVRSRRYSTRRKQRRSHLRPP